MIGDEKSDYHNSSTGDQISESPGNFAKSHGASMTETLSSLPFTDFQWKHLEYNPLFLTQMSLNSIQWFGAIITFLAPFIHITVEQIL